MNFKKYKKIYILCPAQLATGGPELLHQLGHKLIKMGLDAQMYYFPPDPTNSVHPNYLHYQVPFTHLVENQEASLVIFPEILLANLSDKNLNRTHKVIWWLSVDNYLFIAKKSKKSIFSKWNARLRGRPVIPEMPGINELLAHPEYYHLAQSAYAVDFLHQKGFQNISYLSDYLNSVFLAESAKVNLAAKKDQVLYNPKKGFEFTQQLMAAASDLNWIPLENMSPKQVADTLAESKVYIDFGQHPGKDRFPREAAVMGCCIITGKRGSAAFDADLPLPEGFKFEDTAQQIPEVIDKIRQCFTDFEKQQALFAAYISRIKEEERQFDADIRNLFL